jgi:hypothetical protein
LLVDYLTAYGKHITDLRIFVLFHSPLNFNTKLY